MNNFTSMVIAILEHLKLLSEDEAKKLAGELHNATLPDNYDASSRLLKDIYAKLEMGTLDSKVPSTKALEKDLSDLKVKVERFPEDIKTAVEGEVSKLKADLVSQKVPVAVKSQKDLTTKNT